MPPTPKYPIPTPLETTVSQPKDIKRYNEDWVEIAQALMKHEVIEFPIGDKRLAQAARLKFYSFRNAYQKDHPNDKSSPLLVSILQTQVTITPTGDLRFQRDHLGTLLRNLLPRATLECPNPLDPDKQPFGKSNFDKPLDMKEQDKTLEDIWKKQAEKVDQNLPQLVNSTPEEPRTGTSHQDETLARILFGTKKE